MRFGITVILLIIIFSCNENLIAQVKKSPAKTKIDSSLAIFRKTKIIYPLPEGMSEKSILPLPYYNFSSSLAASFTFTDSLGRTTSKTDYNYYFDKTSNFFALKETYKCKNSLHSFVWLEELKDSIGFKANIEDTNKTFVFKHLHNIHNNSSKLNTIKFNQYANYNKTTTTKLIHGFMCEAYVLENEQIKSTLWITVKSDPWLSQIRKDLQFSAYNELTAYSKGIVMLSESFYKQTKHTQRFEVTSLNKTVPSRIVTDGSRLVSGF